MHLAATSFRNNRHAVVTLLAKQNTIVADRFQLKQRKLVVGAFGFLNTEDVWLRFLQPTRHER